jgi:hypothetical protein
VDSRIARVCSTTFSTELETIEFSSIVARYSFAHVAISAQLRRFSHCGYFVVQSETM